MVFKNITILKESFTAKEIADLAECSNKFRSEINLQQPNKKANCKSIMGIISMMLKLNDNVTVVAEGEDEEKALEEIAGFLTAV